MNSESSSYSVVHKLLQELYGDRVDLFAIFIHLFYREVGHNIPTKLLQNEGVPSETIASFVIEFFRQGFPLNGLQHVLEQEFPNRAQQIRDRLKRLEALRPEHSKTIRATGVMAAITLTGLALLALIWGSTNSRRESDHERSTDERNRELVPSAKVPSCTDCESVKAENMRLSEEVSGLRCRLSESEHRHSTLQREVALADLNTRVQECHKRSTRGDKCSNFDNLLAEAYRAHQEAIRPFSCEPGTAPMSPPDTSARRANRAIENLGAQLGLSCDNLVCRAPTDRPSATFSAREACDILEDRARSLYSKKCQFLIPHHIRARIIITVRGNEHSISLNHSPLVLADSEAECLLSELRKTKAPELIPATDYTCGIDLHRNF